MKDKTTHFGFESVPEREKARKVGAVFDSVVERYDLMNDLMSVGVHRIWKRFTVEASRARRGWRVLDLAGGTGDLAGAFARRVAPTGTVVLADVNMAMLEAGRRRLVDQGVVGNVAYVQADAERLPFPERCFDCVSMAFGLRNVTHLEIALDAMRRSLRPGGVALILEFSSLTVPALKPFYDTYSFRVLPWLGRVVTGEGDAYRYLAESIRMHPDQEALKATMEAAGFQRCEYFNLTAGVAALHRGYRL